MQTCPDVMRLFVGLAKTKFDDVSVIEAGTKTSGITDQEQGEWHGCFGNWLKSLQRRMVAMCLKLDVQ